MQVQQVSPIFQLFDQQYDLAKRLFIALTKQFKSKKAIQLEEKLIFLEIYIDLLSKIHFNEKKLKFQLFAPYKELFKCLKKVLHIKLIQQAFAEVSAISGVSYGTYEKALLRDKNKIYTAAYDVIMSTPLEIWEALYREAFAHSKQLKPLMINTSTTQIINEELEYFKNDSEKKLEAKEIKDIYEGLQVIITLENVRIVSGLNATFTELIHTHMNDLSQLLYKWYQNHLLLQHLTFSLSEQEEAPSKKYINLINTLKTNKKKLTTKVVSHCKHLFSDILG